MLEDRKRLIIAMDFEREYIALELADQLDPSKCRLKVGKEMFTRFGPSFIQQLQNRQFEIFLDLKFHDIPNTVANACAAAADLGVWMTNVHASGGRKMMQAAAEKLQSYGADAPLLIAVTILTSMSDQDMLETGASLTVEQRVLKLAKLTEHSGLDGIVCSAQEADALRKTINKNFLLVTPGIRPIGSDAGDQHRVMTPIDALNNGSDYLVIGRPITQASDPLKVMCEISESIDQWLAKQT